jgi:ribosome-binding factor A
MKRKAYHSNSRRNAEVQRALAEIIRADINDPRLSSMTSVTEVIVAPDLKSCKAYISVYGDEKAAADTLAGLQSATGFIKSRLAQVVNMRHTPEITFILDESIAYGARMSQLIDEVIESDKK